MSGAAPARVPWASLASILRPQLGRLAAGAALALPGPLLGLLAVEYLGAAVTAAVEGPDPATTRRGLAVAAGLQSAAILFAYASNVQVARVGERVATELRRRLHARILSAPLGTVRSTTVGELVSRLTADVSGIQALLSANVVRLVRESLTVLGCLYLLAQATPALPALALAVQIPAMVLMIAFGRMTRRLGSRLQELYASATSCMTESVSLVATVKGFAREAHEVDRYAERTARVAEAADATARAIGRLGAAAHWAGTAGSALLVGFLLHRASGAEIGRVLGLFIYVAMAESALASLSDLYKEVQHTVGRADRLFEILAWPPESGASAALDDPPRDFEWVGGEQIGFRYTPGGPLVLDGVGFRVGRGEVLAVVGPSGAGKTTLAQLIARYFEPTAGRLLIEARDAGDFGLHAWRRAVSVVDQNVEIFSGTVLENIAYGNPGATREEVERAARMALLHDVIARLDAGYDTVLGERGSTLSGGERQRLSIARAILKDAPILVLDEPTSALDIESELAVQDALMNLVKGRATILISHRLGLVRSADRILVLQNGRVEACGTHDELLAMDGYYRRAYARTRLELGGPSSWVGAPRSRVPS